MPRVSPDILRWARQTAGLMPEEAAKKLHLHGARGRSAVERLAALEGGDDEPTRAMLLRMAKQYRRPLVAFYLSAPPRRGDRGQDFRTLPGSQSNVDEALLDALIRDVRARQSMVRALLEDEEEAVALPFIGSMTMSDGASAVLASIRETLQVNLTDFWGKPSPQDAFALLRDATEGARVFVLLIGDLGSHHTAIDVRTFRGFALADETAPFVVINDQDSRAAWSFTLLHELAHLWIGQTGVSGAHAELEIERFCNDVASEYLLPRNELREFELDGAADTEAIQTRISDFARRRNLSNSMVAYRLYSTGAIDQDTWTHLSEVFRKWWRSERLRQRGRARDQQGGPNYYVVRRHRVGKALIDLVGRMVRAGAITTCKAGKVLGVKPKHVQELIDTGGRG